MGAAATHLCPKDKSLPDTVGLRLHPPPCLLFLQGALWPPLETTRQSGPFPAGSLHYWVGNETQSSL